MGYCHFCNDNCHVAIGNDENNLYCYIDPKLFDIYIDDISCPRCCLSSTIEDLFILECLYEMDYKYDVQKLFNQLDKYHFENLEDNKDKLKEVINCIKDYKELPCLFDIDISIDHYKGREHKYKDFIKNIPKEKIKEKFKTYEWTSWSKCELINLTCNEYFNIKKNINSFDDNYDKITLRHSRTLFI